LTDPPYRCGSGGLEDALFFLSLREYGTYCTIILLYSRYYNILL
jgi:hypothetical protein